MNKHIDMFLAKAINQWVNKHRPPADGRERLLQKAAAPLNQATNKFALSWLNSRETLLRPDIFGLEWPRKLTGWLYFSSQAGYGNL
jgi:hypothetical protein